MQRGYRSYVTDAAVENLLMMYNNARRYLFIAKLTGSRTTCNDCSRGTNGLVGCLIRRITSRVHDRIHLGADWEMVVGTDGIRIGTQRAYHELVRIHTFYIQYS